MKAFSVTWLNQVTVYTGDINYKAYLLRKQLPACRRLLFPLLHVEKAGLWKRDVVPFPRATKEIGDVCTQAKKADQVFFFLLFTLHSRPLVSFDHVVLVTNEAESA